MPVEYLAVRTHLTELREEMHPQGTIYERGKFIANNGNEWEVGVAEVEAGNVNAARETERAIAHFQPDVLLFVGIAGGIKDVKIGDVVVGTKVYGYESGKVGDQFFTRPDLRNSDYALVERAKTEKRKQEWLKRLVNHPKVQPDVFVKPIAADEKVVASKKDLFKFLREHYNDAIAVEMEGFGFLSATFPYPDIKAIVIRGISDLIEGKNDDSLEPEEARQEKASHHASTFAFEILAKFSLGNESELMTDSENPQLLSTSDELHLLNDVKQTKYELSKLDRELDIRRQLEPDHEDLKNALNWFGPNYQNNLAQRIVREALEKCPNLKQIVKGNTDLENFINWEFAKYIENIYNSLKTKYRTNLYQPPIPPFTTLEGHVFGTEEREKFKDDVGIFYTLTFENLKTAIPRDFSKK